MTSIFALDDGRSEGERPARATSEGMQFKRLRLSGFKSFVEPADLLIEPGLTGVVGPNGCGKSNLLEAIRWVMGESSAKSMRGGGMEDVIFAGTASRPARDFAEVQLFAEQSPDSANGDTELEVVRRIERGAGSAYRLNGRDVRAKDVALIFADAATGAHSPALVSQGKIAAVIAAKPAERRMMLEEAAGIAGLHVRRKDAEQKLRATESNIARLTDIMAGLETQIASLRRQARAAERYSALSDQIRIAEGRLIYARWRDAAAAAEAGRAEAAAAEAAVAEAQTAQSAAQQAQKSSALAQANARDELADRRALHQAQAHRLAQIDSQLVAARDKLADLARQITQLDDDRGEADRLTRDAADALSRLEGEAEAAEATLAAEEARRPQFVSIQDRAERAAQEADLALAQATAAQAAIDADWRVAEAALGSARARMQRLEGEVQRIARLQADIGAAGNPDIQLAEAQSAHQAAVNAATAAREALGAMETRREVLSAARGEAESALSSARADLASLEREQQALERDQKATRVAASGVATARDGIKASTGYERALAAVLGSDAGARVGVAPLDQDGRFWTGADAPPALADSLAGYVTAPPQLAARLALVRVADRDEGQTLAPGEWLVTREGFLRRWDGFVARGGGAAEAERLTRANRLEELLSELPGREQDVETAQQQLDSARAALTEANGAISAQGRIIAEALDQERAAMRACDAAEAAKARLAERRESLSQAQAALAADQSDAADELALAEAQKSALPDVSAGRAQLDEARLARDSARSSHQAALVQLAALDQALAVGRERKGAIRADIRNWQARSGEAARRLVDMTRRREELEADRAIAAAKPEGLARDRADADAASARLAGEVTLLEAGFAALDASARAADQHFSETVERLGAAREARAGAIARAENQELRRVEMGRVSGERFECPPVMLPEKAGFDKDAVAEASAESAIHERLMADRERIGPVNLVAARELAEAEATHGANATEMAELTEAVHRLRGSIGSLNREGRERLRAAFEQVDTHFQRLFSRLFNGGQAHLALIDSDDPLEAGLEIFAQPPGKRLQSLTLLSGGEQALTAVALIFALFLTNPAPICVLDEVDAPLDDANIERFCDLLDAMVAETRTRYLIVTHNAVTMSRMHRLFGVTMVEQGVSRLVSVDLGAAEQLLAAE